MSSRFHITPGIPGEKLSVLFKQSAPIELTVIVMKPIEIKHGAAKGFRCNRKHDPLLEIELKIDGLTDLGGSFSFLGIATIQGYSERVKGNLPKSGSDGMMDTRE